MDEDSVLELVTQYLRSKNLSQTANFLWKEKEDLDREDPDSLVGSPETSELSRSLLRILKSDSSENTLSVAVPFSGRKIDSHGQNIDMLTGEDIEYQGEAKSEELLQEKKHRELGFDDNSFDKELEPEEVTVNPRKVARSDSRKSILTKSPSFEPILKSGSPNPERKAQIHFSTEIETTEVENDDYLDADDLDENEHRERDGEYETRSRGSRTSSILRSRTGSTSSARSSNKSVSFVSSSEDEDDDEEEEDLSSDEWSDDDDPGYVKVPIEALDYFQYSEDEEPLDHEEQEIEDGEEEESNYKFKNLEFVENPENEDENENDEWELPATQDESHLATQEGINSGISYPAASIAAQQLDQSQEELEFEKLNQILRKHIQTQKDEYYQEWNPEATSSATNPSKIEMRTSLDYHTAVHGRAMDRQPQVFESTKSEPDPLLFETKIERHSEPPLFESNPTEPTEQPDYPIHYESFNLPIICESGRTGLQESKDFPIEMNTVIAGRYQILEYLGSAAFSKAIRCHDLTTEHQVCIKIIKNNKEFLDQSLDEIRLLQYINASGNADEKNVLQLYDYFYFKEHLFIVTELLRDNLYEFYKYNLESGEETYFTIERLKRITKQCLVALEFVHSLNLIHCDLKPENILIKSYSRCEVKIIDFGSSCFTKDHLSSYVQSRSYRAPEVILGYPYNSKIDLWSLGCILAELWTGKVLFHNESIPTLLARTVSILGPYDPEMLKSARYAHKYFTKTCSLYEKKQGQSGFTYLKPKRTTLKARLKTEDDVFVDFVSKLLAQNPSKRLSATEALQHPFLKEAQ